MWNRIFIRLHCWRGRKLGKPFLYDKFGYPYWLHKIEDLSDCSSTWLVVSGKQKSNPAIIVRLYWDEQTFSLGDISVQDGYKNRGLGSQILTKIKAFADSLNLPPIARKLTPSDEWTLEALASWYISHGFDVEVDKS